MIDTHAHVHDHQYDEDRAAMLERAGEAGVERIVTIGTDLPDSERAVRTAEEFGLLATIGIHGVMASSVSQRTSEFGVRMALGANPGDVLRMVSLQGLRLIAIGIAGGLLGALALSRVISSMLFEVGALDPLTLAGACLVLGLAAFAACLLSAFRATRIDPIVALRGN